MLTIFAIAFVLACLVRGFMIVELPHIRSRYDWGRTKNEHARSNFFSATDPWGE